uniref:Uncharacterized protein n=1 Tax=Panagrolaimus sp. ES5 TaxID=591445 RepID=A0AC34G489_9BILA
MIGFECGGKKYPLIVCKKDQILPFKKTITVPKTPLKYFLAYSDENDVDLIVNHAFTLPLDSQAYQFTLEVDANNFLKHDGRGFLSGKVPALAKL